MDFFYEFIFVCITFPILEANLEHTTLLHKKRHYNRIQHIVQAYMNSYTIFAFNKVCKANIQDTSYAQRFHNYY
jgi:hypothetical protein